ncbi:efflux RND transporter periplasmic adaptor subunit [Pseudoalteromonas piscicida]|uniref:Efflux RND transporter periplasmic adaptor subunit n=1 Tax=Pseudoalteromonas piscicida TaxID=43662 RepID=A0AAQ2ESD1_PSEO7|nr:MULTISPECIES: HlyD family efflux transporter periplasmic adaptor subunit [Pseudoalteromonas]KJY86321.1 RND transporter [Pseudoalteromonas piscicida]TMN34627.1 efflux RND transporter periplasmic adaptor subunit [Pseudoalteromonas piscicida]TMN35143.1 efflux RND transporter periplasmic adaptor subunit [Pseudoalteromonas piscicida]TMN46642.1 efflux RND transporter periplasmic adaptor subunit [Pseudoalteromonas piscicida]TMN58320.1 efflux RND transporter periplasmic adaptor subunit [Pseudoalter
MDRKITPNKRFQLWWLALPIIVVAYFAFDSAASSSGDRVNLAMDKVKISTVTKGEFHDLIPLRGSIMPSKSVYLDAIEGGRVEARFVEEGAMVKKGDKLLALSNTSLQLDVISREAQISEQLNNLHNTRLAIDQNRLNLKRNLLELDFQVSQSERKLAQFKRLGSGNLVSKDELQAAEDETEYLRNRRKLIIEQQRQDEKIRTAQIAQLEDSVEQLNKNLGFARKNLENLIIKAPMDGQLTALDAELGASKARGARLGQVDIVSEYKVSAQIDEFYLGRVYEGQTARLTLQGKPYELTLAKVYAEVSNGRFEVDLTFNAALPSEMRRGQSLQLELLLADAKAATLIPNGGFYQDTGGKWVFVLEQGSQVAVKKSVTFGERNNKYIEVLDGLAVGDRVITSSYSSFKDMQSVSLTR